MATYLILRVYQKTTSEVAVGKIYQMACYVSHRFL